MRGSYVLAATMVAVLSHVAPAQAKEDLVIGISQFPANFNPLINAMVAKSFIHGMTRRPITYYDADWKLRCGLCTELPSIERGTARYETTA